jgi:hypothetical protein
VIDINIKFEMNMYAYIYIYMLVLRLIPIRVIKAPSMDSFREEHVSRPLFNISPTPSHNNTDCPFE